MAFILKSSKHTYKLLGFTRQGIFTKTRKKFLFPENADFFKFNELCARTAATAMPKPVPITAFNIQKNISQLYGNLKASMVDLHVVEQTLKSIEEKNGVLTPSQLFLLLRCCGTAAFRDPEEKRVEVAKRIWKTAKELGTELDIVLCNTLLNVYNENNYKFMAGEVLQEIKQAGLKPNNITYRHLLKAYCQQGDIQKAGKLLEEIKQKNYSINEYDFCSLIQGHCEAGDINEAEKILNVMKERGIQITSDTYAYLLNGYAKFGDLKKIEALLDELNRLELQITDTHLLHVVYTMIINNQSEHVDTILNRIKKYDEKTFVRIVHRLFHKRKDAEALKLFKLNAKMGYFPNYIHNRALGLVEHFVYNRSPAELVRLCGIIEKEGWSNLASSHALKKCVLRMPLEYCKNLMKDLRAHGFPIRTHYFWPLIARYTELGNSGIIEVLKVMKSLYITPCVNTVSLFMRLNYKFDGNWDVEIDILKKHGVRECLATKIALYDALEKGKINDAEKIASTYGIHKPNNEIRYILTKAFAKNCPNDVNAYLNILYCLAHDYYLYNSVASQEETESEDNENSDDVNSLNSFFDNAITHLMDNCTENVFLNVLQNASKRKMIIPSQTAAAIRNRIANPDVELILKDFVNADEFELNENLLNIKSRNVFSAQKPSNSNYLARLANQDQLKAEKLFQELGDKASLEDSITVALMYSKMNEFDKAFDVIDKMKSFKGYENEYSAARFRVTLHNLQKSGNVQRMINSFKMGVDIGLIHDDYVHPVIRTILNGSDFDKAFEDYLPYFEKIKTIPVFFDVMEHLIPAQKTETIEKMTSLFSRATNLNCALTALVTAYLANGCDREARKVLEQKSFRFQNLIFLFWFREKFLETNKTFDESIEVIQKLRPLDITAMYAAMLSKYIHENKYDDIKRLWLQCQEDDIVDPFFFEELNQCVQNIEKTGNSLTDNLKFQKFIRTGRPNDASYMNKILDSINANKCTDEIIEKLILGKLPSQIASKALPVLASEGKINELLLIINKYRFRKLIPEIARELLNRDKVEEFFNLLTSVQSTTKYVEIYNSFAFQEERILDLVNTNHEFFEKFMKFSKQCYEEGKYEALLMFFMKICIQSPEKLAKAEEILSTEDSRIVSHFRNYCLSNMLLNSSEDIGFYKNVLENGKLKSVFSEALDHFYNPVINFHNESGDIKTALSYLNKAKEDGVEEKLSKRLLVSLKKNMDAQGMEFPYPYLLKETP